MGRSSNARQKIVSTAANLIWRNGFEATGLAEILRESNVGSGSFYWFFKSKEDLLLTILDDYKARLRPEIAEPAFVQSESPFERIFLVLDGYRRFILQTNFQLGCPIGNLALELGDRYDQVRNKAGELFDDWRAMITECLESLSDRLPTDCNFKTLSVFVLTTMEGGIMQARVHKDIVYFDDSVAHLRAYLTLITKNIV